VVGNSHVPRLKNRAQEKGPLAYRRKYSSTASLRRWEGTTYHRKKRSHGIIEQIAPTKKRKTSSRVDVTSNVKRSLWLAGQKSGQDASAGKRADHLVSKKPPGGETDCNPQFEMR